LPQRNYSTIEGEVKITHKGSAKLAVEEVEWSSSRGVWVVGPFGTAIRTARWMDGIRRDIKRSVGFSRLWEHCHWEGKAGLDEICLAGIGKLLRCFVKSA